jgi:hypothetical protein
MALDFGANKEFDLARNRAKQQEASNLKGQKDALARRAAQLGGGPSGAFIKQEQIAGDESAKRLGQANEGIDAMQAQEQRRLNEIEQGQKFVTGERLGSQDFGAAQAKIGREFTTSERMGSQDFGAAQAKIGREFMTSERLGSQDFSRLERLGSQDFASAERLGSQDFSRGERLEAQDFGAGQAKLARDLQSAQFDKTFQQALDAFAHEKYIDAENLKLAARVQTSNEKGGPLDNLLGGFSSFGNGKFKAPGGSLIASLPSVKLPSLKTPKFY